jgi:hypothetical protein
MAINQLTIQEMVSVTNQWVDPSSRANAVLTSNHVLKTIYPQVVTLNTQLLGVRKVDVAGAAALTASATEADGEHDFWVEAIVNTCDAVHPTQPTLGLEDIRQWLFPRGVQHARDSYGTEVGYAAQKATELDSSRKKQLKGIVFGGQTLLQWVDNYFDAAKKLGDIEAQRAAATPPTSSADALAARRAFLGLVKGLEAAAKLAGLSEDDFAAVFGLLKELSARKAPVKKKPQPAPAPVPPAPEPTPAPVPQPAPSATIEKK